MLSNSRFTPHRLVRWFPLLTLLAVINLVSPAWSAATTSTSITPATTEVANNTGVALVARVTSSGSAVRTGTVRFCDANAKICFGAGLLGQAQLTSAGTAQTVVVLAPGAHSVKAIYNGTTSLATSTSAAAAITVAGPQPSVTLGATGSVGNYAFSTSLTAQGFNPITGNVSIVNTTTGGTVLGTSAVGTSTIARNMLSSSAFATGSDPSYMVSGDFNGDGFTDFAVANTADSSITIMLGTGGGAFRESTVSLSANVYPEGLAVGDFNNDGILDLAVAENNNSAVQILIGQGDGSFSVNELVPAGAAPDVIAVADFNRDGQLDIAVVNEESLTVTILLGNGDGTFTALGTTATVGYFTTGITVGDFNNDGIPDLAVANYFGSSGTVLLGNGDGTFTSSTLNTGVYPVAIAAGDFNNDGKLDLVVANQFSQTLTIFLGDGAGHFTAQTATPAIGQGAQSVTVADFNQDGKLDIAVAESSANTIQIFNGNGDGTFGAPMLLVAGPSASAPNAVVAADLNGDGLPDLAVANSGINQVQTFLNIATATATAKISGIDVLGAPSETVEASYSGSTNYAAAISGGLNVAGKPLTTTTTISAGESSVGLGETVLITGTLTPGSYGNLLANGAVSLLDGTQTIATGKYSAGVVTFNEKFTTTGNHSLSLVSAATTGFLGSTSSALSLPVIATTTSTTTLAASAASVSRGTIVTLTATVTSNGKPVTRGTVDFCNTASAVCEDGALVRAVQLNTAGTAALKLALPVGTNNIKAVFVGTGEIKGSSTPAKSVTVTGVYTPTVAATASGTPGNYTIAYTQNMNGWQAPNIPEQSAPINLIDTSNHNLLIGQMYTEAYYFPFVSGLSIAGGTSPFVSTTGDFNGDGKMDVAFASNTSGPLTIELGNGNGTFKQVTSSITLTSISALIAGDFNGDGILDLAAVDSAHNKVTIALGAGNGTFTTKATYSTGTGPNGIVLGDFNNDGILDLAVTNATSNSLTMLLGHGDGTFVSAPVGSLGLDAPSGITAADFNGDGYIDLAITNHASDTLTLLYGNGDGTFSPQTIALGSGSNPGPLVALDFNGDGKPDLAVVMTVQGYQQLVTFVNQGNESFTPHTGTYVSSSPINNLIVADFNGDGRPDVAFTDAGDGFVFVCYNTFGNSYDWNEESEIIGASTVGSIATGDFDGDGGLDLVVTQPGAGNAAIALQRLMFSSTIFNVSIPGTGAHNVVAVSPAIGVYTSATSSPLSLAASPVSANVQLLVPNTAVTKGETVNITAKVFPLDNFVPTGTISIYNGNNVVKTATPTNNEVTFTTTFSSTGTYLFTATYNGDANLLAAASPITPIYVVSTVTTSKTTLSLSATTAAIGSPVTLTASTVTAANAAVHPGVIDFCDATAKLCDNAALLGTAQLTSKGTASIKLTLDAGTHLIKAVYAGSETMLGSTSASSTLVVSGLASTATQLTSTGSAGKYTLTAKVTGQAATALTGTVSFNDATSNVTLGQATLGAATANTAFKQSPVTGSTSDSWSVVNGDFNNDGKQDIAVIDESAGVTVYLGNGTGGFTAKPAIAVQCGCNTIVAGDFNGDGKLDLAVTGYSGYLSILLGNGDGTFNLSTLNYGSTNNGSEGIYQLAVADINHDGKLDLVGAVVEGPPVGLAVFLGNGDGTFTYSMVQSGSNTEPAGVAVADFNGDGNLDVAVSNFAGDLLLFLGNGAGGFTYQPTTYLTGEGAVGIVTADFNGDGKADLAVTNFYTSTVTTLLGNGDGTFTQGAITSAVSGPYNLAVSDFNLDGKPDLVVISDIAPEVSILLGNGSGGFSAQTIAMPAMSVQNGIAIADWNGDGRPDIFLPNFEGTNGSLLLNETTSSASATLSGVVVGGTLNQSINAKYAGSKTYAGSTSNTVSLAP